MKRTSFIIIGVVSLLFMVSCTKNPTGSNTMTITDSVTDVDGNVYHAITIGTQTWTIENLKTTKYNDGTAIPLVTNDTTWGNLVTPGYCWYDNDSIVNKNTYGALYNWYAVHTGKLAPAGWHVPTDSEWNTLEYYLIAHGCNWDKTKKYDKIAKSIATKTGWDTCSYPGAVGNNLSANNKSGLSILPCGFRSDDGSSSVCFGLGSAAYCWSSTEGSSTYAFHRCLWWHSEGFEISFCGKGTGMSVRLVRD